jgi:hypothetical protein
MKLVDTNLLLFAVNHGAPLHERAHEWLDESLTNTEAVAFAWQSLLSFVRISTRPNVFRQPLTSDQALNIVDLWLSRPVALIIEPAFRHREVLRGLLAQVGTAGNLVPDAHLAALAIEHGATLYSFDNDFSRFPGLRWKNPLKA